MKVVEISFIFDASSVADVAVFVVDAVVVDSVLVVIVDVGDSVVVIEE